MNTGTAALGRRLAWLDARVAAAVRRRRAVSGPAPAGAGEDGGGQGVFISETDVDRLLAGGRGPDDEQEEAGDKDDRWLDLGERFDLDPLDLDLLMAALAPDVDVRFDRLYAYLHDDMTARRPTIGLCLELCGMSAADIGARVHLRPDAPLGRHRLVVVESDSAPFPSRVVRVPDRVVDHLLGADLPEPAVLRLLLPPLAVTSPHADVVANALAGGVGLFYLRGPEGGDHAEATGALVEAGHAVLTVDLGRMAERDDPLEVAAAVAREAGLRQSGLVAGPIDELATRDPRAVEALAGAPGPVVLLGSRGWEPEWSGRPAVVLERTGPDTATTAEVWRTAVGDGGAWTEELSAATATFRLSPHQVLQAVWSAEAHAAAHGGVLGPDAIRAGARAQNGGRLESLARMVRPRAGMDDLVLAEPAASQVAEVAVRARLRARVVGDWQMRGLGVRGTGITALFAGPSGTGKTLAAEVIAGTLGLDLFVVDLSSVVDKYIGETEKNLEAVFRGAHGVNGVLFFDEADALFGKRSAGSDGHDRYANIEVAYLLQRMEQFEGVSLLATNLTANLDDAFARRIDVRVVFPLPEAPERRRLWERHLPPSLPLGPDVDVAALAESFRLAGGDIANAALTAAYAAAALEEPVGMSHLVRAIAREYRKLGRLCTKEEFGPWFQLVAQ